MRMTVNPVLKFYLLIVGLIVTGASLNAHATQPGSNGIISAYEHGWTTDHDTCSTNTATLGQTFFNSDLTNPRPVVLSEDTDYTIMHELFWAPDGNRYAFKTDFYDQIGIARTNGTKVFGPDNSYAMSIDLPNYSTSADSIAWSPDGQTIAFSNSSALFTVKSNATDIRFVTWGNFKDLSWSSDGSYIAFTRENSIGFPQYGDGVDVRDQIGKIHPDGSGIQLFNKASDTSFDKEPDWSPDNSRLVFSSNRLLEGASQWTEPPQLFITSANGSNLQQLTNNFTYKYEHPVWSPDGTKILAVKTKFTAPVSVQIVILNASSGAELTQYTPPCNVSFSSVGWQPIVSTPITYPSAPVSPTNPALTPIYRFYSPLVKHHLFTADTNERTSILQNFPTTVWKDEGVSFRVNGTSNCFRGRSVYRFYSESLKTHLYTMDEYEKQQISTRYPANVWRYEGVAYCADSTQVSGTQPVYRFYSPLLKTHLYTMDQNEKNEIVAKFSSDVWKYEGIAYYAYPK